MSIFFEPGLWVDVEINKSRKKAALLWTKVGEVQQLVQENKKAGLALACDHLLLPRCASSLLRFQTFPGGLREQLQRWRMLAEFRFTLTAAETKAVQGGASFRSLIAPPQPPWRQTVAVYKICFELWGTLIVFHASVQ